MRKPRTLMLVLTALLLGAAATLAIADGKKVRDDRRETKPLQKNGRLDIVVVKAGHRGELVKHTVVMRKRVAPRRGKERPLIAINTRGGRRSDPEYLVRARAIFKQRKGKDPKRVGDAELRARGRRWIYRFDPEQIRPGLRSYGWAAIATKGNAFDIAPAKRYKLHRLG